MSDPDLSAIGSDAPQPGPATDMAKRESLQFELDRIKEDHDHSLRRSEGERGVVGRFFGSKDNAITYIATGIIVLGLILISIFALIDQSLRSTAVEVIKAIVYAGVGVLTGKNLGESKDSK